MKKTGGAATCQYHAIESGLQDFRSLL